MAKWNKDMFIQQAKTFCQPNVSNVIVDLVKFAENDADQITWGRGEGHGTMTFRCKSDDFGDLSLFHITTNGQIKFQVNYLRSKIDKPEIMNDFQLKLETNFLLDLDCQRYPSDIFHNLDELFTIKKEVDSFVNAIQGITARLRQ